MEAVIKKIPEESINLVRRPGYIDYSNPDPRDIFRFMLQRISRRNLGEGHVITERHELNRDYLFEINSKSYQVPSRLMHIAEQIEEAQDILKYEFDWDGEGACPTDITTFENAISFIINYSVSIYDKTGTVLKTPYMDILRDGSVSVHWESENAQLLTIFKKGKSELAYYFAELKENKVPLKSAIEPGKPVDEFLALWMQMNLS